MAIPLDEQERTELCGLFSELGPDAPTLCAGWTTADLAGHLVLRDHFKRWPQERIEAEKAKGFNVLVERILAGAPLIPWRIPGARRLLNGMEYFIHLEDVRRANGGSPRTSRPELENLCWRMTAFTDVRLARSVRPFGFKIASPDGRSRSFGSGDLATLSGPPTELVLYLTGRHGAAQVELSGSAEAMQAIENSGAGL